MMRPYVQKDFYDRRQVHRRLGTNFSMAVNERFDIGRILDRRRGEPVNMNNENVNVGQERILRMFRQPRMTSGMMGEGIRHDDGQHLIYLRPQLLKQPFSTSVFLQHRE